ncbi:MAG: hypothetical protein ACW991_08555 [Candidatus Hodarchaeales archaeon]|jgi:hypothetical protein
MLVHEKEEKSLFQISEDNSGELEPYKSSSRLLKKDSVYVLLDNTLRKIFLWIGQSANVRSRFIASTAAQKLRKMTGLTYRVITIDQGGESKEFLKAISPMIIPGILERIVG